MHTQRAIERGRGRRIGDVLARLWPGSRTLAWPALGRGGSDGPHECLPPGHEVSGEQLPLLKEFLTEGGGIARISNHLVPASSSSNESMTLVTQVMKMGEGARLTSCTLLPPGLRSPIREAGVAQHHNPLIPRQTTMTPLPI